MQLIKHSLLKDIQGPDNYNFEKYILSKTHVIGMYLDDQYSCNIGNIKDRYISEGSWPI